MRARPIRAVSMSNSAVRKISWFKAWVRGFLTWGELFTRIVWAFLNPCSATWKEEHQSKRKFTCLPSRLDGWFIVQCTISNLFQIFISRQFYKINIPFFFNQSQSSTTLKSIYSEKVTKFCKISTVDWPLLHMRNLRWRLRKNLWPSQNIWTLTLPICAVIGWQIYV